MRINTRIGGNKKQGFSSLFFSICQQRRRVCKPINNKKGLRGGQEPEMGNKCPILHTLTQLWSFKVIDVFRDNRIILTNKMDAEVTWLLNIHMYS